MMKRREQPSLPSCPVDWLPGARRRRDRLRAIALPRTERPSLRHHLGGTDYGSAGSSMYAHFHATLRVRPRPSIRHRLPGRAVPIASWTTPYRLPICLLADLTDVPPNTGQEQTPHKTQVEHRGAPLAVLLGSIRPTVCTTPRRHARNSANCPMRCWTRSKTTRHCRCRCCSGSYVRWRRSSHRRYRWRSRSGRCS